MSSSPRRCGEALRLPVWVDNDVNDPRDRREVGRRRPCARANFVTLSVGRGIGLGIVIDRGLYRGATGGAASSGT